MSLEQAIQELTAAVNSNTAALLAATRSPGFVQTPAPGPIKTEPATDTSVTVTVTGAQGTQVAVAETPPVEEAPPYKEIQGLVAQCLAKLGREATVKIVTQDLGCKKSLVEYENNPAKLIEAKRVLEAALQ